jgi:hypothetical protein
VSLPPLLLTAHLEEPVSAEVEPVVPMVEEVVMVGAVAAALAEAEAEALLVAAGTTLNCRQLGWS